MKADGNYPQIGNDATSLGVRVSNDGESPSDIPVEDGRVKPGTGGMSVAPSAELLPSHRIPKKFRDRYRDARGSNALVCWQMGEGPFVSGPLADRLVFRNDPARPAAHGFVEPDQEMTLTEYQEALAATQSTWKYVPWVEETKQKGAHS
jgi:hypothetical protein